MERIWKQAAVLDTFSPVLHGWGQTGKNVLDTFSPVLEHAHAEEGERSSGSAGDLMERVPLLLHRPDSLC